MNKLFTEVNQREKSHNSKDQISQKITFLNTLHPSSIYGVDISAVLPHYILCNCVCSRSQNNSEQRYSWFALQSYKASGNRGLLL